MARKKAIYFYKNSQFILNCLEHSGLRKYEFAKKLNITRATLDNWINQGGISYDIYMENKEVFDSFYIDQQEDILNTQEIELNEQLTLLKNKLQAAEKEKLELQVILKQQAQALAKLINEK